MLTAYDILLNLKEMFGEQGRAAWQIAMKALLNTKMAEGSPVQEHVLTIIFYLNELEVLGTEVDGKTQIDIVLMSLPESFSNFCLTYNMSKSNYSLTELLKELQAAEGIIGQKKELACDGERFFLFCKEERKEEVSKAGFEAQAAAEAQGRE